MADVATLDPVLSQRRAIARLVSIGKRTGYGLYLVAIVVFGIGYAFGYTTTMTTTMVVSMAIGSIVLAPAIVYGYGVKAAEREERRATLK